jgi:protein-S-isoprenylcysteine O-methyltransferase Ste14
MLAVGVNLILILLFGMQHSIMARSGFKTWLHRTLPPSAERSVYVLMASLVLALLMWQWRPIPAVLWQAGSGWAVALGWTVYAAGFGLVFLSTFLIDHFDLFGIRQVWFQFRGRQAQPPQFKTPFLYRLVRHPLYLGFLLAFWGGPLMTAGHFLFAAGMSVYILIAIQLEERDLVRFHGPLYEQYRERVPMLIPTPGRRME